MAIDDSPQDLRVLVTGADGFIGSHTVETMLERGADVTAFCMYNSFGSRGWLEDSSVYLRAEADGRGRAVLGDIRDAEHVSEIVRDADVVLHLAALIGIPHSYVAPRSYVETNVVGTLNVLEAARRSNVRRVVHTSTSEVYGTPDSTPIRESHALRAQSPYAASKIAADKLCESYALSFELPVIILRPFNTFGPRQSARAVIPTVLRQLLQGASELHLGAVDPRRDFTFVSDTARAFASAAVADLDPGTVVQLGTGRAPSIREVVELAQQVVGRRAHVVVDQRRLRPSASEVQVLQSDPARAQELLAWSSVVSLEEGLRRTADWLSARLGGRDTEYQT